MKSTILSIGGILIAVNLLFGLLLSAYAPFNMWFNTIVIAVTTIMLFLVQVISLKDAFKVSLTILLPISFFIKIVMGCLSPERIEDNWCVIVCLLITLVEALMIMVVSRTSKCVWRQQIRKSSRKKATSFSSYSIHVILAEGILTPNFRISHP